MGDKAKEVRMDVTYNYEDKDQQGGGVQFKTGRERTETIAVTGGEYVKWHELKLQKFNDKCAYFDHMCGTTGDTAKVTNMEKPDKPELPTNINFDEPESWVTTLRDEYAQKSGSQTKISIERSFEPVDKKRSISLEVIFCR